MNFTIGVSLYSPYDSAVIAAGIFSFVTRSVIVVSIYGMMVWLVTGGKVNAVLLLACNGVVSNDGDILVLERRLVMVSVIDGVVCFGVVVGRWVVVINICVVVAMWVVVSGICVVGGGAEKRTWGKYKCYNCISIIKQIHSITWLRTGPNIFTISVDLTLNNEQWKWSSFLTVCILNKPQGEYTLLVFTKGP